MNFQLFSDIHIELIKKGFPKIEPLCNTIILAGDIGIISRINFKQFIEYCSLNWENVIYVFGNHEFYGKHTIHTFKYKYRTYFETFNNVHLLDSSFIELNGVIIYGFISWTRSIFDNTNTSRDYLNDYNKIKYGKSRLRCADVDLMVEEELEKFHLFIDDVNNNKIQCDKILVVTHFPPIREGTSDPKYNGELLSNYFSWNNLMYSEEINCDKIKMWCSGHTHWSYNFIVNDINFVSNQIGYFDECIKSDNNILTI
jgi:hypothetical protein